MSNKIYRQYDSRWAAKPYPTANSSFGGNGCGCCSVLHLMLEVPKYELCTPESIRPYMVKKGYAAPGNGTYWNGINGTMKHYGLKNVTHFWESQISSAWKHLNKGKDKMGVILFAGGTRGGVTWTEGGHYVAFTDYEVRKGNKHYFYMKDSGWRKHDGWYCYEKHMKGLATQIWICDKPTLKKYIRELPTIALKKGSKGEQVKLWQKYINWYFGNSKLVSIDGKFGSGTEKYTKLVQESLGLKADGRVGHNTLTAAKAAKR